MNQSDSLKNSTVYMIQDIYDPLCDHMFFTGMTILFSSTQDACSGVHSACREENKRKVGIYVQLLRQGKVVI